MNIIRHSSESKIKINLVEILDFIIINNNIIKPEFLVILNTDLNQLSSVSFNVVDSSYNDILDDDISITTFQQKLTSYIIGYDKTVEQTITSQIIDNNSFIYQIDNMFDVEFYVLLNLYKSNLKQVYNNELKKITNNRIISNDNNNLNIGTNIYTTIIEGYYITDNDNVSVYVNDDSYLNFDILSYNNTFNNPIREGIYDFIYEQEVKYNITTIDNVNYTNIVNTIITSNNIDICINVNSNGNNYKINPIENMNIKMDYLFDHFPISASNDTEQTFNIYIPIFRTESLNSIIVETISISKDDTQYIPEIISSTFNEGVITLILNFPSSNSFSGVLTMTLNNGVIMVVENLEFVN